MYTDSEEQQAQALIDAVWREHCAPPPQLTVTEWAETNRVLSSKDSSEPGPYRVSRAPYAKVPQDCLGARSLVEEVVLMWGHQTSKTTVGLNWIGYTIDQNPGTVMIVWPTINTAKRNSRQRLTPMLDATPSLRRKVSERKSRDEANTMLLKDFAGGVLAIVGANSGSDLRAMPIRDVFLDEVDAFPHEIPGEGSPIELAEARQSTFNRRKRLKTSTPLVKGASEIEAAYLASDRCRYYVPCPHCGEFQVLEWGATTTHGIKWDRAENGAPIARTIRYVCRHNGCEIQEHLKPQMLADGEWRAESPEADGRVRGFHLSSLYSPLGWLGWAELARKWHAATKSAQNGDRSKLRTFVNLMLAETFDEDGGEKTDEHALKKRALDVPLGIVQWGHYIRTCGVDVQGDRLELYDWAWGRGMRRQLVNRAIFRGDPAIPETEPLSPWAALTAYRRAPVKHVAGPDILLAAVMIDSGGHHTQQAYVYARQHRHEGVHAVKGLSIAGRPILGKPSDQDISYRGDRIKGGVKLWPLGVDTAKAEIYGRLRVTEPGAGYVMLSKHLPDEVFAQITAERLTNKYVKGRAKLVWTLPTGSRNEGLDCAVYALAGAHWCGLDRWRGEWDKLQASIEPADGDEPKPAAAPRRRMRGSIGGGARRT